MAKKQLQQLDTPLAVMERELIAHGYVFNRVLSAWVHRTEMKWMVDLNGAIDGYAKVTERDEDGVPIQRGTLTAQLVPHDKLIALIAPVEQPAAQ